MKMLKKILLASVACLSIAGPAHATTVPSPWPTWDEDERAFRFSYYAANYCHLKGRDGEHDMKLNTDKILLDIGAEKLAYLLRSIEEGRNNELVTGVNGDGSRRMTRVNCDGIWIKHGPSGKGWLMDGGISAGEIEKLELQDREKELRKAAPVVIPVAPIGH